MYTCTCFIDTHTRTHTHTHRRVVRGVDGRAYYQLRAKPDSSEMDSLNIAERDAFMKGKKLIAIISDAASTGV